MSGGMVISEGDSAFSYSPLLIRQQKSFFFKRFIPGMSQQVYGRVNFDKYLIFSI